MDARLSITHNWLLHILLSSDELDEDELFTVCLDDDGHPVQRAVRDMTAGEVIAAIDHLTVGSTRIEEREKLARLRQVVAQKHPRPS